MTLDKQLATAKQLIESLGEAVREEQALASGAGHQFGAGALLPSEEVAHEALFVALHALQARIYALSAARPATPERLARMLLRDAVTSLKLAAESAQTAIQFGLRDQAKPADG